MDICMDCFDYKGEAIGRIFSSFLDGCAFVPFSVEHIEDEQNGLWEEYVIKRTDGFVDRYRIYYMDRKIEKIGEAYSGEC